MLDFLVETCNPEYLDKSINYFGAAVIGGGMPGGFVTEDGYYIVRCFGNPDFVKFAIENQGYGRVVKDREMGVGSEPISDIGGK